MAVERTVIAGNIKKVKVKEYLARELERAGIGEIDIQRTPMDTRVIIFAQRPGIVIGKKGATIKQLTEKLSSEFGLDNPQIEVNDLPVPSLSAPVVARNIASSLERGYHFRRAAYSALRDIMNAGAIGAQITLSGKLTGERSRMEKFMSGYIKHCGEPSERLVLKGFAEAAPKLGRIGVKVKILPPGVIMPDNISIIKPEEKKPEPSIEKETPKAPIQAPKPSKEAGPKEKAKKKPEPEAKKEKTKTKKPKAKAKTKETVSEETLIDATLLDGTAKDILKAVKGMDKKLLKSLIAVEEKNKNRKTVIAGIKKQIPEG